jgi:ribosome-binding factor A
MGKGYRQGRLAEEIRKIVSELILRELKDPRLPAMVTVTAVEVTADSSYATIFLTVFGSSQDKEEQAHIKEDALIALQSAKGYIRREIGRLIKLRHVPDLIFKFDTSAEYGRHIEELLSEVVKKDETE